MWNELARRDDGWDSKLEVPGISNSKFLISRFTLHERRFTCTSSRGD